MNVKLSRSVRSPVSFFWWGLGALWLVGCVAEPQPGYVAPVLPEYKGPDVPDRAVWRPFAFTAASPDPLLGDVRGTAVAVRMAGVGEPVILTALHAVMDQPTPVTERESAIQIQDTIEDFTLTEAFGADDQFRKIGRVIRLAHQLEENDRPDRPQTSLINDVLALSAGPASRLVSPLPLSPEPVTVGDEVWMATSVFGGASPSVSAHVAVLESVNDQGIIHYAFKNPRLSLRATSGAPLLDAEGAVVGIHLAEETAEETIRGRGVAVEKLHLPGTVSPFDQGPDER